MILSLPAPPPFPSLSLPHLCLAVPFPCDSRPIYRGPRVHLQKNGKHRCVFRVAHAPSWLIVRWRTRAPPPSRKLCTLSKLRVDGLAMGPRYTVPRTPPTDRTPDSQTPHLGGPSTRLTKVRCCASSPLGLFWAWRGAQGPGPRRGRTFKKEKPLHNL
jgi:hypothetical protein